MKKILKGFGMICLLAFIGLLAAPFIFKDSLKEKFRYLIHQHVDAHVDFHGIEISFLRNFPKTAVTLHDLAVINHKPFAGDTLAYAKKIKLVLSIQEFFKSNSEPIQLQKFVLDNALFVIQKDSIGRSNLDIAKAAAESQKTTETKQSSNQKSAFALALRHYEIKHTQIRYQDDSTHTRFVLNNLNHVGDGVVSGNHIALRTHTDTKVCVEMAQKTYLKHTKLQLDATLDLDLEQQRYTFKENKAWINQLPIALHGFVQQYDTHTMLDLRFETPNSDFKNLLALVPAYYAKDLKAVQTTGDFSIQGTAKGRLDAVHIPKLDIAIAAHQATFRYPDLPKAVRNIQIDAKITNTTGMPDYTTVQIDTINFSIDQDRFGLKADLKQLQSNMLVNLDTQGILHLENLEKAYPIALDQKLSGIFHFDLDIHFDLESLKKERYAQIQTSGLLRLQDFRAKSTAFPNPVAIREAHMQFTPNTIRLETLSLQTGKSDLVAKGTVDNVLGYLFTQQGLKGNFEVTSETIAVADLMTAAEVPDTNKPQTGTTEVTETPVKIPAFLDATLAFGAQKVLYDNLVLRNTSGILVIKDQTATIKNLKSKLFDGDISLNSVVSTQAKQPSFGMQLGLSKIDMTQSFAKLPLLQALAPIAKALTGTLDTNLDLKGNLTDGLSPILSSLHGSGLAKILNAKVNSAKSPLLSQLNTKMNFLPMDRLDLQNIQTAFDFEDGKVKVKPFAFKLGDFGVQASGHHSFDQAMAYQLAVDVPAKYMGAQVKGLLQQLDPQTAQQTTVAIPIGITGNFGQPKIQLQTAAATKQLTQRLIAQKKQQVQNKLNTKLQSKGKSLVSGLLGSKKSKTDSTAAKQSSTKTKLSDTAKDIFGGLFGNKKK